jgi:ribonucleoside-triphosphate reductase
VLKRDGAPVQTEDSANVCCTESDSTLLLFATKTCPNCKMAAKFLDDAGIAYRKLLADEEPELAAKYGIKQAPTLIIENGEEFERIVNVSNIRKFTEQAAVKPN